MGIEKGQEKRLSPNQAKFCELYLQNNNGTRAYMEAYNNTNVDASASKASTLLRKQKIIDYIAELKSKVVTDAIMTAQETMKEISKIAKESKYTKDKLQALNYLMKYHSLENKNLNVNANITTINVTLEDDADESD